MAVEFVGIDPDTDLDHCPTVWADAEAREILPGSEAIVRIPARMIPMIREACDAVERAQLR